jgi:serine/threonine-protein kinase
MLLEPGDRLGSYRIEGLLGSGAMGVVYRATDTRLGRQVAIKTLPAQVARDPERLSRFEREARVLASLSHPNVATLYGFETHDDSRFLVMELVEGDTLADRIGRAPIPVDDAVRLFVQIAAGLEAAHEKGIIHRDLKPANIKLGAAGDGVKILDFGLAKAMAPAARAAGGPSESPTITHDDSGATREGQVLGTAAYMSPEQATGAEIDRRADVWALGACLFEALTGRRAFPGNDAAETLAAVLRAEVDWKDVPPATPRVIRTLLRRCLTKDPRNRVHDVGDVRIELESALDGGEASAAETAPAAKRRASSPLWWGVAALAVAIALLAGWLAGRSGTIGDRAGTRDAQVARRVTRHPLAWPAELRMTWVQPLGALSPDGSTFVYGASSQLYVWRLGDIEPRPLPGTEGGANPFFSPDGQSVAFFTRHELKRVALGGEIPETICEVSFGLTGTWGPDGTILYGILGPSGLWQVPAGGGRPAPFSTLEPGDGDHDYADFLPGGEAVVYTVCSPSGHWDRAKVVVQSRASGERRTLVENGFYPRYLTSGHLIFARGGRLFAARLDAEELEIQGDPKPVLDQVVQSPMTGIAHFAVANNGTLLYARGGLQPPPTRPVWVDRGGVGTPSPLGPARYDYPSLSSDGRRLLAQIYDIENGGLWIFDVESAESRRLTFAGSPVSFPIWSSDYQSVFYRHLTEAEAVVYAKRADGSGVEKAAAAGAPFLFSASPDGRLLLGHWPGEETGMDLVAVDLGSRRVDTVLADPGSQTGPMISPDGRWLVYVSDESGEPALYVRPFPDLDGGKWQVSGAGEKSPSSPQWRADGGELFYRSRGKVVSVVIDTSSGFRYASPTVLFEGPYVDSGGAPLRYAAAPDGSRFLMFAYAEESSDQGQLILAENWSKELELLVPTGD